MAGRNRAREKYRLLYHEADMRLAVYGDRYEDLFANGAWGLFSIMLDVRKVRKSETRIFSIPEGPDALIEFLNELLYLWDTGRFIAKRARVTRDGTGLSAVAEGEVFDPLRHRIRKEVKAATYHRFSLENRGNGYEARLVLDI